MSFLCLVWYLAFNMLEGGQTVIFFSICFIFLYVVDCYKRSKYNYHKMFFSIWHLHLNGKLTSDCPVRHLWNRTSFDESSFNIFWKKIFVTKLLYWKIKYYWKPFLPMFQPRLVYSFKKTIKRQKSGRASSRYTMQWFAIQRCTIHV